MKKRRLIVLLIPLLICYLFGPFVAGALRIGDRLGPVFYPESAHSVIYVLAHETFHHEEPKPREPTDSWMYRRPHFYGLSRRLKSATDREAYIELARRNGSPRLGRLIEMNKAVATANQMVPRPGASD